MEWNKERIELKILNKFYGERRMYETIVTKYEWVQILYDEDCRENDKEVEWKIPSQTCRLDF